MVLASGLHYPPTAFPMTMDRQCKPTIHPTSDGVTLSNLTASAGLKVRIEGQPLASVLGIKSRFRGNGGEECSVEELALQYYAAQANGGWTGKPRHHPS